jgi:hypothetical protein
MNVLVSSANNLVYRFHHATLRIGDRNHPVWRNYWTYAMFNRMTWEQMQDHLAEHYSAVIENYDPAQFIGTDRYRVVFDDYLGFVKFVAHWSNHKEKEFISHNYERR